jgi:threonine dehydratase
MGSNSKITSLGPPADFVKRVRLAAERLAPFLRKTPTLHSHTFSDSAGCEVFLKLENLQRTGSFKIRGAVNRVLGLTEELRQRGLIAASAGNHAQGVALAAKLTKAPATIVMPESTPLIKIRRTEGYGAKVLLHGGNWDQAQARAMQLAAAEGFSMVHPFDDPSVIEGQATIALELLADVPDVDVVLVPIGGGGLLAGTAMVLRALRPEVRIIGVQAEGADAMARSFEAGERVEIENPRTMADGIRVGSPGELTWEIIKRHVDSVLTVSEAEITTALVEMVEKSKVVAEPAGVVGIAALVAGKLRLKPQTRVCALITGGNIDLNFLARVIESGLADSGFYHHLQLRLQDVPGHLAPMLKVVSEHKGNVLDVQHYRAGWRVPVGFVDVELLIETRSPGAGEGIERALAGGGFKVRRLRNE